MPRLGREQPSDEQHAVRRSLFIRSVFASDLPPNTRLVLFALAWSAGADGHGSYVSNAALSARTGLCERAVWSHLAAARKGGWLASAPRHGRSNDWLLRVPIRALSQPQTRISAYRTPPLKPVDNSHRGVHPAAPQGAPRRTSEVHPGAPVGRSEEVPRRNAPPWCGDCDERTRIRVDDEATGQSRRCPHCHPLVVTTRGGRRTRAMAAKG